MNRFVKKLVKYKRPLNIYKKKRKLLFERITIKFVESQLKQIIRVDLILSWLRIKLSGIKGRRFLKEVRKFLISSW